ncbi:MAG: SLBB domain-containing protein [Synergistaceae bacterium]|nr:SLBB domain-containing protein [Synergistaceae bacterium]
MKKAKCFTAGILILALCGQALGADVSGPAVLAAPMPSNAGPYSINAPTLSPAMPTVPNAGTGGVNLTGLDPTSPTSRTENIDATTGSQQTGAQQVYGIEMNADGAGLNTQITEQEINEYFDSILSSDTERNPIGDLFRRLPRYGMSFFRRPPSTYAPMDSSPVTQGYRIGIGDEMTLTVWGIPEEGNFRFDVNRDGMASIPHIGMVRLAGYTIAEAERIINARLSQYYTGFQMNLTMGRLSSIMIYVTGNAMRPGAYTISSFSTLVNALIASGGPSNSGTLRNIELKRNGRTVAIFDMYAMLLQGDKTQDVRLQAGDVIFIPPVGPLVGLAGEVQNPGVYELNGATRAQDLLYIAGGLNARTFKGRVQFYRVHDNTYANAFEGTLESLENRELQDGDIIRLYPVYNLASTVLITGPLIRPGTFAIIPGQTRLSEIINRAGGTTVTASETVEVTRVRPSLSGPVNQRFTLDLARVMQGDPANDITLENMDQITVVVIPEWKQQIRVTIAGEVRRPGSYSMFIGEKLSDLIDRAGGFTPKAYLRGAIFTRQSVAVEQREALNQMADRMERELLEASQNTSNTNTTTGVLNQEFQRRRELINNLRHMDIIGRVVTKVDTPKNIRGTAWDYELQNGDALTIPDTPLTVNVVGAVYTSTTQVYRPDMGINGYISAAGGALRSAHKRMVYLVKPDGTTLRLTRSTSLLSSKQWTAPRGFSAAIDPGDTIIVPVKYVDRQSIDSLKDTIDIIYKVGTSAGVLINATRK